MQTIIIDDNIEMNKRTNPSANIYVIPNIQTDDKIVTIHIGIITFMK